MNIFRDERYAPAHVRERFKGEILREAQAVLGLQIESLGIPEMVTTERTDEDGNVYTEWPFMHDVDMHDDYHAIQP